MKYGKMSKYIYGLAFVMAFLCACRGEDGSCSLSFQQLKVEKTVPLDSSEHSSACKVIIEADEINDTTRAARNMNRTIAFHLFGWNAPFVRLGCRFVLSDVRGAIPERFDRFVQSRPAKRHQLLVVRLQIPDGHGTQRRTERIFVLSDS